MGTATKELQKEIKDQLNRLGWSVKRLAGALYYHTHDIENDDELLQAEERLKKQLQRPTTAEKKLEEILAIIPQLDLFRKTNLVSPKYIASDELSAEFKKAMKSLSVELTDELEKKNI